MYKNFKYVDNRLKSPVWYLRRCFVLGRVLQIFIPLPVKEKQCHIQNLSTRREYTPFYDWLMSSTKMVPMAIWHLNKFLGASLVPIDYVATKIKQIL